MRQLLAIDTVEMSHSGTTRNAVASSPCRWLNQSPVLRDGAKEDLMATLDEKPPEKVLASFSAPCVVCVLIFFACGMAWAAVSPCIFCVCALMRT